MSSLKLLKTLKQSNLDDSMLSLVNQLSFLLREIAPQKEDNTLSFATDSLDHGVSELLPSEVTVRVGFVLSHSQSGVEQKHSLLSPLDERSVRRSLEVTVLLGQLFEDVLERRRLLDAWWNRKAESMCLKVTIDTE
jgi:hypothetical protein